MRKTLIKSVDEAELKFHDAPNLIWLRVKTAVELLWSENPKLHDLGSIVESIKKHGFQELAKLDSNLINILEKKGAIKAGNGRVEALAWMEKDGNYDLPRGLAKVKESGEWVMPLLVGTDAESLDLARSYAIDSNNLTLTGGDFTAYDLARMWSSEAYLELLSSMAESDALPVTVEPEDLQFFLEGLTLDLPDYTDMEDEDIGEVKSFRIIVGDPIHLEDVLKSVRDLLMENDAWGATIKL